MANAPHFRVLTVDNGLSVNNVKVIYQDSYGYMWFGTRNRLNRYDGKSVKVYECYDEKAKIGDNSISALYEDKQKKLWIGTDKGVFTFDPLTEVFTHLAIPTKDNIKITGWISKILQDKAGNIWIIAPTQGLFAYNKNSNILKHYPIVKDINPNTKTVQSLVMDAKGKIWVGTVGDGIYYYNTQLDKFTRYTAQNQHLLENKNVISLSAVGDNLIIGLHEGGILHINKQKNSINKVTAPILEKEIIRHIKTLNNGDTWIGTQSGVYVLNSNLQLINHIKEDFLDPNSLSDNIIENIFQDREGGIWVATNSGGINYLHKKSSFFTTYYPTGSETSIRSKRHRQLVEDKNGAIWISSEDNGVWKFNPKNEIFTQLQKKSSSRTLSLLNNGDHIWAGYYREPLKKFNINTNEIVNDTKVYGPQEKTVTAMLKDKHGKIWLGNTWGVYVAKDDKSNFEYLPEFGLSNIFDILEDRDGNIWVSSMGSGIFMYNNHTKAIKHFLASPNSFPSNSITSITEDHAGQIWFSSERGGISMYSKATKQFTTYSIADGLPDDTSYKILEDDNHYLWFGTNHGLVQFDPKHKKVKVYTTKDGLLSDQFNYQSALRTRNGRMYFGNQGGLISFDPLTYHTNDYRPPIYINSLKVNQIEVLPNDKTQILKTSLLDQQSITLAHDQSNISLQFAALSYVSPESNSFMYKLDGIDKNWINSPSGIISYAKLPAGTYTLHVKGANSDGVWNEKITSLKIIVHPPWWKSKIALIGYLLIGVFLLIFLLKQRLAKQHKKRLAEQREFELQKEHEMYQSKIDLFTNIAHEIRTPVTLITAPLDNLLEKNNTLEDGDKNLEIIARNAEHLMALTNQLLDFQKIDAHKYHIQFETNDISLLLGYMRDQFKILEKETNKTLHVEIPEQTLYAHYDHDSFVKILNNLFSNAFKYCEKHITVRLIDSSENIKIVFQNDGDIIPLAVREKIFDPFFQVKSSSLHIPGTGIGLSLSRSLVELNNGKLSFAVLDHQNSFILEVPKSAEQSIVAKEEINNTKGMIYTLLLVDDSLEIHNFLKEQLSTQYNILTAANGKEAQEQLTYHKIDIVLSDVMMPIMDGYSLIQWIKSNPEHQQIITILLTAKNDVESRIKGLELGADAHVEKPFSMHYLKTVISSLLSNRKREMTLFAAKPYLNQSDTNLSKTDQAFLDKITEIIHENITEEEFGVDKLAQLSNNSRSNLHRKLKILIQSSPIDFINQIRMQKAAQLIIDGNRISEISYRVGMRSPSYFSKMFFKHYGMTPKEYKQQANT